MNDKEIEALLQRYRPITRLPDSPITRFPRTWPWALAAAALLAISVGLHGAAARVPEGAASVDAERVKAIAEDLGRSPGSEVIAEWMARREARAEQKARMARAAAPEFDRQ